MTVYNTWEDLVAGAQAEFNHVLSTEIKEMTKVELYSAIRNDIYGAYKPKKGRWAHGDSTDNTYQRRYSLLHHPVGGQGGITAEMWHDNVLFVTSPAKASPSVVKGSSFHHRYVGALLALMESYNHGIWYGGFRRPAVSNTEKRIAPKIENIIKRNFDVLSITRSNKKGK